MELIHTELQSKTVGLTTSLAQIPMGVNQFLLPTLLKTRIGYTKSWNINPWFISMKKEPWSVYNTIGGENEPSSNGLSKFHS